MLLGEGAGAGGEWAELGDKLREPIKLLIVYLYL